MVGARIYLDMNAKNSLGPNRNMLRMLSAVQNVQLRGAACDHIVTSIERELLASSDPSFAAHSAHASRKQITRIQVWRSFDSKHGASFLALPAGESFLKRDM